MLGPRLTSWTRALLRLLRILAIVLPGTIHPDEVFQSQEVAAAAVFDYDAYIPWEFADCRRPARSIIPPAFSTGIPYVVLAAMKQHFPVLESSVFLVLAPRLWLVILSFIADFALDLLCSDCGLSRAQREAVWHIVSTSWVTVVMMARPLSNTLEAWAVLALLCLAVRLSKSLRGASVSPLPAYVWAVSLGCVGALGVFTRFTLPLFAAAPALALLTDLAVRALPVCAARRRLLGLAPLLPVDAFAIVLLGAVSAAGTACVCAVADSVFFQTLRVELGGGGGGGGGEAWTSLFGSALRVSGSLTLTPLTSLAYNLDAANLSTHGLHPHWQHALVNAPLMFGPAALLVAWSFAASVWQSFTGALCRRRRGPDVASAAAANASEAYNNDKPLVGGPDRGAEHGGALSALLPLATPAGLRALCTGVVLCGLGGLSMAVHQEPRFLAPLLVPVAVLCALTLLPLPPSLPPTPTPQATSAAPAAPVPPAAPRRLVLLVWGAAWLAFNAGAGAFFGVAHQGGLAPALAALGDSMHPAPAASGAAGASTPPGADARSSLLWPWRQAPLRVPGVLPAHLASAAADDAVAVVTYGTYMAPRSLLRLAAPWAAEAAAAAAAAPPGWRAPRLVAPWCVGPAHLPSASLSADPALATRLIDVDVLGRQGAQGPVAAARAAGRMLLVLSPAALRAEAADYILRDAKVSFGSGSDASSGDDGAALPVATFWPHFSTEHPAAVSLGSWGADAEAGPSLALTAIV